MSFRTKALAGSMAAALAIATPFVAHHEGRSLVAYLDPVRIPTICEGITRIDGQPVQLGMTATPRQCDELMRYELSKAIGIVDLAVDVPLPETRRAALASFVYNVGPMAFLRSTLLRKLNAGDTAGACNELRRWVYAGGRKLNGLVTRREAERALCLQGVPS